MRIYSYLRASTKEQDATRAQSELAEFVENKGFNVSAWFIENESGANLKRPELFKLLEVANTGDIILVEQVDRISRLNTTDWNSLKNTINGKGLRVVALDLPTSHQFLTADCDSFTLRIMEAVNAMLLDMLAAVARKDYEAQRKRQKQGIARAKKQGKYKGRSVDFKLHEAIRKLLLSGNSYTNIVKIVGCSKSTISAVNKDLKKSLKDDLKTVYLAPF